MENLSIVIPDYKSPFLEKVIESSLNLNPHKIVVSNYQTENTKKLQEKYSNVKFLNFKNRKNPGDYRNEGAKECYSDYILFLDSDVIITEKTKKFIQSKIATNIKDEEEIVYWGIYENNEKLSYLQKFQIDILRYRFSNFFYNEANKKSKPYCGQSSHFLIKKKIFNKIGGFNPYLKIREDNDFCVRAANYGIKNKVFEDFEAVHLKKFSLISDYFIKPLHATKVKIVEPNIFNIPIAQIGKNLFFQWFVLPILFLSSLIFLFFSILDLRDFVLFNLVLFLLSIFLIPNKILNSLSLAQKIIYPFPSLLIGLNFFMGGISGILLGVIIKIKDLFFYINDYTRILLKVILRNGNPIQIVNFITARCNLRCNHCFYKDTLNAPNPGEMSLDRINNYTKKFGKILWYALGGGEPFIRNDLHKMYEVIYNNCRPKVFTIPTNGWYIEKIFISTLRMLQYSKGKGSIIIQFSIDGDQKMHDQIRGINSFKKVKDSIDRLKPLQNLYGNLYFSIITVVNDENCEIYPDFVDDLVKLGTNQININLFRYLDYEHPALPAKTVDKYKEAVERYEKYLKGGNLQKYNFLGAKFMRLKEALQKDLIYEVAKYDKFVTPCTAGTLSYVVWEDGRVNACEILNDKIGDLDTDKIPNNFFQSKEAKKLRNKIKDTKCKCTYECAMSTNTFFSWKMTRKMIKAYITNRV